MYSSQCIRCCCGMPLKGWDDNHLQVWWPDSSNASRLFGAFFKCGKSPPSPCHSGFSYTHLLVEHKSTYTLVDHFAIRGILPYRILYINSLLQFCFAGAWVVDRIVMHHIVDVVAVQPSVCFLNHLLDYYLHVFINYVSIYFNDVFLSENTVHICVMLKLQNIVTHVINNILCDNLLFTNILLMFNNRHLSIYIVILWF